MIISRTPLRLSFVGGGTDFEEYHQERIGKVISTAIDKYIYVTVNRKFDDKIHLRYSEVEECEHISEIKHAIIREALKMVGISRGIEVVTVSDIPMRGSGLGSSSALAVGLLNALYFFKGHKASPKVLAEHACKLEIEILKSPIGKQDQYACAYGGFNLLTFNKDKSVDVQDLRITANYEQVRFLEDSSLLFYLTPRQANDILKLYSKAFNLKEKRMFLDNMVYLVSDMKLWLEGENSTHAFGRIIGTAWEYKKKFSPESTTEQIEKLEKSLMQEALGIKMCGAGGGGFMLVMCEKENQYYVRKKMKDYKELEFKFEERGSEIVYRD